MSTFNLRERPNSRTGDDENEVRRWVASGSVDTDGVRMQLYSVSPSAIITGKGILYRQNVLIDDVQNTLIYLSVLYAKRKKEEGTWTWDFDDTGGSLHIKVSKSSVARFPGSAKDHKQLIGVNGDEIAGADIVYPMAKINVGYSHPQGVYSLAYAFALSDYTSTVNSVTMLTRPAGEILFMGHRGSDGTEAPASVNYVFAHSKNLQGLIVGTIEDIEKDGWDVSWIAWKDNDDDDIPGKEPLAVYVERVYDRVNHPSIFGFGG